MRRVGKPMRRLDSHACVPARIADRTRPSAPFLLGGQDGGDLAATAYRLLVSETALRVTIDTDYPSPSLDVLASVITEYGVDPNWLLFGEYDANTHRAAVEKERRTTPTDVVAIA